MSSDLSQMPDAETVLDVRELTKVYPDGTVAVDDISFSVDQGDFCVIIGPSGCGKTTTLHTIAGKIPATEGSIVIGDREMTDVPVYERDIGLVFQDFQLFPHMTVEENIRYGLDRMGADPNEADRLIEETLELVDLKPIRNRKPGELSAGQQQRVALSRSIVLRPKLLLLDEPLGDLDYKLQKRMERELLRIHRELDTTIVHVTHDQRQAMRLADQVVVLNDGQIEQDAPVEEIYTRPSTAFVATFVGDSNMFTGELTGITDDGRMTVETPYGEFLADTANLYSEPAELVGSEIPFAVRPRFLRLIDNADNTIRCAVDDVIRQPGSGTRIILEATGEGEAMELQLKSNERLAVDDDSVTVGWDAADSILLEKTSVVPGVDLRKDVLGE